MSVEIYTKPNCGYCLRAKNWLNENKVPYTEHTIGGTVTKEDVQARLVKMGNNTQVRTVPQIFFTDKNGKVKYIGGYTELAQLSKDVFSN